MSANIVINHRIIGEGSQPYVVAELSANHNGNLDTAFTLIELAKSAGADAIKIQTYKPDTITLDCKSRKNFRLKVGLGKDLLFFELYESARTPWEWHKPLFDHARNIGITILKIHPLTRQPLICSKISTRLPIKSHLSRQLTYP